MAAWCLAMETAPAADLPLVELAVGNGRVAIPVAQAAGRTTGAGSSMSPAWK
jgi:hypothetical protein